MLASGTLLQGRYLITRPIGRGGMAAVYEAVDSRLQNTVAVKQMTVSGPESNRAFEREAQLLAGLRHHALPVVIDYFVGSDGQFLVMQYIDGEDLAHALRQAGDACDPDEVRSWAVAVLDALAYLHERQPPIVHRDIKPANIKCTPAGEIVLLDFGLAKGKVREEPHWPGDDRSVFGYTMHYAPLEQLEWRPTDARSDIYALGATLFHLLTGVPPPSALRRAAEIRDGHSDPLGPPSLLNRRVDASLDRIIIRAMALAASDRYESAAAMRADLGRHDLPPVRRRPRGRVRADRRVDAAMPSQVQLGRQADLLIQVRFPRSPLLGLEDWPSRHKPPRIEQATESLKVVHAADPRSGETLPARLQVRVVAPDFTIDGRSEFMLDVPPHDYSKRLALLLTPQRAGHCRVNIEVHGADGGFLGLVPVETEALGHVIADRTVQAATLVLGALTRQVVEAIQRGQLVEARESAARAEDDTTTLKLPKEEPADLVSTIFLEADSSRLRGSGLDIHRARTPRARPRLRRAAMIAPIAVAAIAAAVLLRPGSPENSAPIVTRATPIDAPPTAPTPQPSVVAPSEPRIEGKPQRLELERLLLTDGTIRRLDGETDSVFAARVSRLRADYERANALFNQRQWLPAQEMYETLEASYPNFQQVKVKTAMARARALEEQGNLPGAIREYTRARELGANVDEDFGRVLTKARTVAAGLLEKAKMAENFNPSDAIGLYRQIVALLPVGDPNRAFAEARLKVLTP